VVWIVDQPPSSREASYNMRMTLEEFIEKVSRERPAVLTLGDLAPVRPKPWVLRAGNGTEARIRMLVGDVRYEREQGEEIWHLSQTASDFDTEAE